MRFRTLFLYVGAAATGLIPGTAWAQADWDGVAQCESGGNWSASTGNGYSGGLQFSARTWAAHGGTGSPANASKAQQIAVAERVLASQGPGAWPNCFRGGSAPRPQAAPASAPAPRSQPQRPAAPIASQPRTAG